MVTDWHVSKSLFNPHNIWLQTCLKQTRLVRKLWYCIISAWGLKDQTDLQVWPPPNSVGVLVLRNLWPARSRCSPLQEVNSKSVEEHTTYLVSFLWASQHRRSSPKGRIPWMTHFKQLRGEHTVFLPLVRGSVSIRELLWQYKWLYEMFTMFSVAPGTPTAVIRNQCDHTHQQGTFV